MEIETLVAIAKLADNKHVRIELLPTGFCITAKKLVKDKGMAHVRQMISYIEVEMFKHQVDMFEAAIDTTIARLQD